MNSLSLLERYRLSYQPDLPAILQKINHLVPKKADRGLTPIDPAILTQFPQLASQPLLTFEKGDGAQSVPLKVGVVFSGGQAPGGHNVISGLFDALKQIHSESELIGFLNGPQGIIKNQSIPLTEDKIAPYRNLGGFDLIGSGRTKIESQDQFLAAEQTIKSHGLDGLLIIGGDDSNTNAAFLAEFCKGRGLDTSIVGVPKTIDGDLRNDYIELPFGFDTASKIYAEGIGNLAKDALSAKKYYFFIKMMGRSASHLTLECALQTKINLAFIGEEVAHRKQSLKAVIGEIADLICERAEQGKDYGIILIPEGLIEFIPECQGLIDELNRLSIPNQPLLSPEERSEVISQHLSLPNAQLLMNLPSAIRQQLLLERDPHGNIQLSKIETERLLIALVEKELILRKDQGGYKGKFNPQPLFFGYEGRSALPTNFDANYCYALGHIAALLIRHKATGYMACLKNLAHPVATWQPIGAPILEMLHLEIRSGKQKAVIQKYLVDMQGRIYQKFQKERGEWRLNDRYNSPGPIQFCGPSELCNTPPYSLLYQQTIINGPSTQEI